MAKRHPRKKKRAVTTIPALRYEDAILLLWNLIVVPRSMPFMRALARGFDLLGLMAAFTQDDRDVPMPWYAGAIVALPLLVAFFTRTPPEQSELVEGVPRLAVGPALYLFLAATFHAAPDGPLAAALAFFTMVVVGISGMMARDGVSPVVSTEIRRGLVFPAVLAGATYFNITITTPIIREFTTKGSVGMNILGGVVITLLAAVAFFLGIIAPRTLAGDYAPPWQWILRFAVFGASIAVGAM
ncbi:MAG TPA: hypothetical protein VHU41_04385 [Thermoanaerobaculia bacterium]|nr:hypothetical protein [Thermoanaerobaculia bacterium]